MDLTLTRERKMNVDTRVDFVYFSLFSDSEGDWVKIGVSNKEYGKRLAEHQRGSVGSKPINFRDCAAVKGNSNAEGMLKRYFSADARNGETEVFYRTPRILEYICWLRDQYFVYVPDDEHCEPLHKLESLDASHWLPTEGEGRRKPFVSQVWVKSNGENFTFPPRELTGDDFYTPPCVTACMRKVCGVIDLDPASHAVANREVHARRIYTVQDDGLKRSWAGNVWLNPPFGKYVEWGPKAHAEWKSGRITHMGVLLSTRQITAQYMQPLLKASSRLCTWHGRIRFWGKLAQWSPNDGHCVIYLGGAGDRFEQAFSELGLVWKLTENSR